MAKSLDLKSLSEAEQLKAAQRRSELLLVVRERSEHELSTRLQRIGFDERVVAAEVARAVNCGLVDDARFARGYISAKQRHGWGQNRIQQELRRFGIDARELEGYPEQFFVDDDELQRAVNCLETSRSRAKDQYSAFYRKLLSKGFSSAIAQQALRLYFK